MGGGTWAYAAERPPEVRPFLPELNFDDQDILEGIDFLLPNAGKPVTVRLKPSGSNTRSGPHCPCAKLLT
jgi:hypothetical protein